MQSIQLWSTREEEYGDVSIEYEQKEGTNCWSRTMRSSVQDCDKNLNLIIQLSSFSSECELLQFSDRMGSRGRIVIIYNLWEHKEGKSQLDFDQDTEDIQIPGPHRDAATEMAERYPSSKHFLTYKHSLRSYASILYLSLPPRYRLILRGKRVDIHEIADDMMSVKKCVYHPIGVPDLCAEVTMGFVKDTNEHINVQGFSVYYKNRLIKPFWRVWNPSGSDGRGIIGVLEANFIEPTRDKQGFEDTHVLQKLRVRLMEMQKCYWRDRCHEVGYCASTAKKGKASGNATVASACVLAESESGLAATNTALLAENRALVAKLNEVTAARASDLAEFVERKKWLWEKLGDRRRENDALLVNNNVLTEKLKEMEVQNISVVAVNAALLAENSRLRNELREKARADEETLAKYKAETLAKFKAFTDTVKERLCEENLKEKEQMIASHAL